MHIASEQRPGRVVLADDVAAVVGEPRRRAAAGDGLVEPVGRIVGERRPAGSADQPVVDVVAVGGRPVRGQVAAPVIGQGRGCRRRGDLVQAVDPEGVDSPSGREQIETRKL